MKADDDTYVILENLRYFLRGYKSSDPVYCGHHFKTKVQQGYYSGGAGYVLSKEALTRLATASSL
jgi:glycoprotein-N-acetylgalactosamine 3-beta-galactosyltransferase